jgi:hypothetical protein
MSFLGDGWLKLFDKQPLTDVRTIFGISEMAAIFSKTGQNFKVATRISMNVSPFTYPDF